LGYLLDGSTSILLAGLPLLFSWLFWYFNPTGWFASLLFATSFLLAGWYFNPIGYFAPYLFGTSIFGWYSNPFDQWCQ
jgi:hypothetical protein